MINSFKKIALVFTFVISSFAFSNTAFAGADVWLPGSCVDKGNGMMTCEGSIADIHNQGNDSSRRAYFMMWTWQYATLGTNMIFGMQYNGKLYTCTPPANMLDLWKSATGGQRVYFNVTFGFNSLAGSNNGVCTGVSIYSGSDIHLQ